MSHQLQNSSAMIIYHIRNVKMQVCRPGILAAETVHKESSKGCFLFSDERKGRCKEIRQDDQVDRNVALP